MATDTMNPATAVTWGPFIQAAVAQYTSQPSELNPATIKNMPAGYTLVRTIQMTDSFGPQQQRVLYGFVAVGGDPKTAVIAIRGTESNMEWWDDFQWGTVPFTHVANGGNVAQGFYDIYNTFGTMTPGQQESTAPSTTFAADVAQAATQGLAAEVDPGDLPVVVTGHSLGAALATMLVADLTANTALKPQAWTFASPRVGARPSPRATALSPRCHGESTTRSTSSRTFPSTSSTTTSPPPPGTRSAPSGRRSGAWLRPLAEHLHAHAGPHRGPVG